MTEPVKNIAASIQARLKNEAKRQGRPFAEIFQYYAMERFLFRLSKTKYAAKFILKGGLLLYVWNIPLRRPTKDIDFRGYVVNSRKSLLQIFREVIAESAPEDGIVFDPKSILVEETQIDADYQGIRAKLIAQLGRSKISIQIDIGFSDEVASKAESVDYPNILPGLKHVRMKGYPKESVVAEKFHAMVHHAELNSRMKDYYDLWLISETFDFDAQSLQKAIETTFKKRDTELPVERPIALTVEFASVNQVRWSNFLKKMNLETNESSDFINIIEKIWLFLQHPLLASVNKTKSNRHWTPHKSWK
jgi:predicted nucleotidyltransferase component of viral defense system